MRADVIAMLAQVGRDPKLLAKSRYVAEQYMKDPSSVDSAIAGNALATAALQGDSALYDKYLEHMKAAKTPQEYYAYFGALGVFPDPALVKRTYDFTLGPEVKNQDLFALFGPLSNYPTQVTAWELFKSDFPAIMKKVDGSGAVQFAQAASVFCDVKLRGRFAAIFRRAESSGDAKDIAERERVL
jgi:hypothetical protein